MWAHNVFEEERKAGAVLLPVGWIPEWTNEKTRRLKRPTEIYIMEPPDLRTTPILD